VNLGSAATVDGFEVMARAKLPAGFSVRATVSSALGEGPNPLEASAEPLARSEDTIPLSRVPPINGTAEARWESVVGAYLGAGVRWAGAQQRLAIADRSDARIPKDGTPGFCVLDVRAGYRYGGKLMASFVLENVTDAAYRYHGSSINGAGRGLIVQVEGGL
jgi:outer membrane receptor protein involved in Fe transport